MDAKRRPAWLRVGLVGLALVWAAPEVGRSSVWRHAEQEPSKAPQQEGELVPGAPVEREMRGGDAHVYRLALAVGQYVRVVVAQRGIDVVVRLFGPDGREIVEVDSPTGTQGEEVVSHVADATGTYRLEVRPLEKEAPPGRYEIRIEELRQADEQDRTRVAAQRALAQAELLRAQGTAESLRQAIAKYEEAARLFQALGDRRQAAMCFFVVGASFISLGEYRNALDSFLRALPLFQALRDRQNEGRTLIGIGRVYDALGERQKALEYFGQALSIRR
ncbi:MAG: tetratricopeptide repeat protein, partial [bacterium JZ-2024 1]